MSNYQRRRFFARRQKEYITAPGSGESREEHKNGNNYKNIKPSGLERDENEGQAAAWRRRFDRVYKGYRGA